MATEQFDLIVVGTGFASSFFLLRYLQKRPQHRVLVLERGRLESHAWKRQNRHLMKDEVTASIPFDETYENRTPDKPWIYTPSVGGSSNCWFGCVPRLLPNDFKLKSTYGVGTDWPLSYDDLEPYYCEVEDAMAVAGPSEHTPFRRSKPYPQKPHRTNDVDAVLARAYPDQYFVMPAARPTSPTANRPRCCASGVCNLCPADAKFTILNELLHLYHQPNVTLQTESTALSLLREGGRCTGVVYRKGGKDGKDVEARANVVALGANALFNAHVLLSSGLEHPWLGRGLTEQVAFSCTLDLNGIDNFSGSTMATGHGYMLYDGVHRKEHAACLIENINVPQLRMVPGKYRQTAYLKFIFEDLPEARNAVLRGKDPTKPALEFHGHSQYAAKGIENAKRSLDRLLSALPIERVRLNDVHRTQAHILGTARMGDSASDAVVDRKQALHALPNVLSLGGSSFPSISPANPTLTLSALSLWSADQLLG